MKYIKKHLSTIVISFIIGVFLFYIQPILNYVGNKVVEFFIFTSDSFSAMYYEKVATNNPYIFDDFNGYLLTLGAIFFFLSIIKELIEKRNKTKRKIEYSLDKIKSLRKKTQKESDQSEMEIISFHDELAEVESSAESIKLSLEKKDNNFLSLIIVISFMSILLLSNHAFNKSITQANVLFRNKSIILLPYVGEENINLLKSEWAQMKNSSDYKDLMKKIEEFEKAKLKP